MMKLEQKLCSQCHKNQKCLIYCNECGKFYCSRHFKEYEMLRQPEQHTHAFSEVIKSVMD